MSALRDAVAKVAGVGTLLVAVDFDGTLAPIVSDPSKARADPEAMEALLELARMPRTRAAILSGRALRDLATLTGAPSGVTLVGSHGAEFALGLESVVPPEAKALLATLTAELEALARTGPGVFLEVKPSSVALHYRAADEDTSARTLAAVLEGPARRPGVYLRHGKKVIELCVLPAHKGHALDHLRREAGADGVVFVGDDVTDEDALASLRPGDLGVKVGLGATPGTGTKASHAVADVPDVASLLRTLAHHRCATSGDVCPTPIEQHALLSDQRAMALVTPSGRIVWLCTPRLDSAPLLAQIVDTPAAGFFDVRPVGGSGAATGQRYVDDSFVLETSWPDLTVRDYLDCSGGRAFQRAGRSDLVRVIEGPGVARVTFAPRLDFGRLATRLVVREGGLEIDGSPDPIVLCSPGVVWRVFDQGQHQTAEAEIAPRDGPVVLELRYGTASFGEPVVAEAQRREQTVRFWGSWAASLRVPAMNPAALRRSALALRALSHGPTGAIAAATTTSLPEEIGGVRNWDYRYCWPRDAALSAGALARLGNCGSGLRLLDWLLGVLEKADAPERLRPLYTVTGGHLGSEGEIGGLAGYRGSRPVRVGNAAAAQVQLDVFGPIVDLVYLLGLEGAALTPEHWGLVQAVVDAVGKRWREPDHGIWEVRTERRHHVHSKVMCWLCVDRGIKGAERFFGRERPDWAALRDAIAEDVLANGYNQSVGAFTAFYGTEHVDAAALQVGLSGLLPPDDPRFVGTVSAVERVLRDGPTVYRYRCADGLPGTEGGFHLCAGWLGEAYLLIGKRDEARRIFDAIAGLAGPTGLLSEQYDPRNHQALGNFPQAYSHLALINLGVALARTESLAPAAAVGG